jgi:RNase H-like domain found in reverse transcriptase
LSSVQHFKVITDHKNLRYFMTQRRLNERQMRWADILSRYDFVLQYRPGKLASRPDALSRREQDMPAEGDKRLEFRDVRLFNPDAFIGNTVFVAPVVADTPSVTDGEEQPLEQQWEAAERADEMFEELKQAVRNNLRRFPTRLKVNTSIAECELDEQGRLRFRGRRWVPENEPLRTRLIQETHD